MSDLEEIVDTQRGHLSSQSTTYDTCWGGQRK